MPRCSGEGSGSDAPLQGMGAKGKHTAGGRFAAGETDLHAGRETNRQTAQQPAKPEGPGQRPKPYAKALLCKRASSPKGYAVNTDGA